MVRVAVAASHGAVALEVSSRLTEPEELAAGVYVTLAGVLVCKVLLSMPPPETMDQAPVVAPPPTLAPPRVMATGVADWHTVFGPPALAVEAWLTVMVRVAVAAAHGAVASVVSSRLTEPE